MPKKRAPRKDGPPRKTEELPYETLHFREISNLVSESPHLSFLKERFMELEKDFELKKFLGCYHLAVMTLQGLLEKEMKDNARLKVRMEEFNIPSKALQPVADTRIDSLEKKLGEAEEVLKEIEVRYERLRDDFEGYKKRAEKRLEEATHGAKEKFVLKFLPVLDNLDRALSYKGTMESKSMLAGIEMIKRQLEEMLEKEGFARIVAAGCLFDPVLHEAAESVYTSDVPEDTVVEEVRTGYRFGQKVIRPALVKIAKASLTNKEDHAADGKDRRD